MSEANETDDEFVYEELEGIACYGCGAIEVQLYLNHLIEDYAYRQVTCKPCALIWQKNGGSW
tara:strand:- start:279 stop:464 length:186 start_codon:yes stop_codon:yes gene_type:complete